MELGASDIISIISLVVALLFGGGWLGSYVTARRKYRNEFIRPLKLLMDTNRKIFAELTRDANLDALEYMPDYLQRRFNELDDSNPIKYMWKNRMDTIIANNEKAIVLITANTGEIKSKELREACHNFVSHAQKFNDIWNMITTTNIPFKPGREPNANLLGDRYPADLDKLLEKEAGRRSS
jgi:hypothetical protein